MSKTIEQLREAAQALEKRLASELDDFLKENGVAVGKVDLQLMGHDYGFARRVVIGHEVRVRLETGL